MSAHGCGFEPALTEKFKRRLENPVAGLVRFARPTRRRDGQVSHQLHTIVRGDWAPACPESITLPTREPLILSAPRHSGPALSGIVPKPP